ncbi:MAG: hypothetical protein ACI97P_002750 [Arcticibacterium sp.]|jgi:hypothetical protein
MKKLIMILFVIFTMTSITSSHSLDSENTMLKEPEPCCQNGYATWKKRSLFGGNVNFFDCQCAYYFARPQLQCSCGDDL